MNIIMILVPNLVTSSHKSNAPEFIQDINMFSAVSSKQKAVYLKKYIDLLIVVAEVHQQIVSLFFLTVH